MNTYLVKIFLKILRGGKCGGYHEGKDRHQTVAYLSNRIIHPIFKKFNRKASICQECFSIFQISMFLEYTYHTTSMPHNSKKCLWHTSLLEKYIEKYNFVRPTSLPRFHCSLGYRTPAEVTYKYTTVNGNGIKNSEVVL